MDIIAICVFAIVSAVFSRTVEANAKEIKLLLVIGAAAVIFMKTAGTLGSIIGEIRLLFDSTDTDQRYVGILLKGLGICYVTDLTCGICRDSGEHTLADQTLSAGKAALVVLSLPMLEALTDIVKTLLV